MTLNENGLYDIYGVRYIPFWQTIIFYRVLYAVLFLCAIGVCFYGVRWWLCRRNRRRKKAWERALYDLELLRNMGGLEENNGRQFYSMVSDILKKYVCERYGIDFSGKTDKEMVYSLREYIFSPIIIQQLITIFENGQMVKFAGGKAIEKAMEQDFDAAIALIKSTIPDDKK